MRFTLTMLFLAGCLIVSGCGGGADVRPPTVERPVPVETEIRSATVPVAKIQEQ